MFQSQVDQRRWDATERDGALTKKEAKRLGAYSALISPILQDIFADDVYCTCAGCTYLTDRETEVLAITSADEAAPGAAPPGLLDSLTHSLPFVQKVPLDRLLELRRKEGESFRVYRDAVAAAIGEFRSSGAVPLKRAVEEFIRPEIDQIDLLVRNSKRLLWGNLSREAFTSVVTVSVGLFAGFFHPGLRDILLGLGGMNFLKELGTQALSASSEPPAVRESKLYFLWRARKVGAKT